jgi:hypothetical protein
VREEESPNVADIKASPLSPAQEAGKKTSEEISKNATNAVLFINAVLFEVKANSPSVLWGAYWTSKFQTTLMARRAVSPLPSVK